MITHFVAMNRLATTSATHPRPGERLAPMRQRSTQSMYSELTDSSLAMRRIVSASSPATESWRILLQALRRFATAGWCRSPPARRAADFVDALDRRARQHRVRAVRDHLRRALRPSAPAAALHSVPAVSTMSSMITQVLPVDLADDVHHLRLRSACGRRLSMIARSASSRRLASARARTTPPTSGDTTIRFS